MRVSPPQNYYLRDCEADVRQACKFLEKKGLVGRLIDDFELRFESDDLVVSVVFEKNSDSVTCTYFLPDKDNNSIDLQLDMGFDIGWTIATYKNGLYKNEYISRKYSKVEQVKKYIDFFRDFEEVLLDREFSEKMRKKYDVVGVKTID